VADQSARFSADGQDYTRTLSPTVGAAFTVLMWARLAANRGYYTTAWCMDSGTQSTAVSMQTDVLGGTMRLVSGSGTSQSITAMTVGTWYCFAVTRSATGGAAGAVVARYGTNPAALSTFTLNPVDGQWSSQATFTTLRLGESIWNNEWLNGNLAAVKIYTRALDATEAATELGYYNPVSTTGLYAAYPFWDGPSTTDTSGNGRTLSGGSGTTAEAGPGIPQAPSVGPEPGRFLLAYP
jgi:hypothetical protein